MFWPGDTDVLAGHEYLYVEVFCPQIGGAFTMDRHTAADPAEAMDPDLDLPAHSDPFDAIETKDGVLATELRFRDGLDAYDARSNEDADGGEHGEDDADCQ